MTEQVRCEASPNGRHCDHTYGPGSGGVASDGSGYSRGTMRCCFCGRMELYEYQYGPTPPTAHGTYYAEILRCPT